MTMAFDPNDHMLTLKGKKYLQVAPRLHWFRQEHPEASIETECTYADEANGVYRFKAIVTMESKDGKTVRAIGHGMATRKEFPSGPSEKAETKAVGRALLFLGYGTLNAQELDDDEDGVLADSPVERSPKPRTPLAVVPAPVDVEALRTEVLQRLEADPDAASKLPKAPDAMNAEELGKTLSWMSRRARASS